MLQFTVKTTYSASPIGASKLFGNRAQAAAFSAALGCVLIASSGCQHTAPAPVADACPPPPKSAVTVTTNQSAAAAATPVAASAPVSNKAKTAKRYTYTPRPYPVDERGFSPVDKALAKA